MNKSLFGLRKPSDEDHTTGKQAGFLKDANEKMMLASLKFQGHEDLENVLLEAFIWPKAW
jgi:hypothetical protein